MGLFDKFKQFLKGESVQSSKNNSKTITFENDNGVICYKIDGVKYNSLDEIPDPNDREQARRITFR
ncbi:MAG TPA: hypothetical protein PK079_09355 [Leptospiraceae bacterium]|nr:hypothetical protein [Leptospiraceae bacterium]HMW06424.1 hypothetical protein [Leptospiraceae bacterium]HMX31512.1 hypothetical protein [Leptospiraceae bacterium]HMY31950.1 hypothetical protein [Leptospiraceae bacterium]HMZ63186.1 hypothetical protein [Leptospiraceae bacterium]